MTHPRNLTIRWEPESRRWEIVGLSGTVLASESTLAEAEAAAIALSERMFP